MKQGKKKQKPGMNLRSRLRFSMKTVLIAGTGVMTMAVVGLVMVNMSNPFSSEARSNETIEVVNISDQEFTNEHTLDNPVIIQPKINSENVILIREKKVVNAQ